MHKAPHKTDRAEQTHATQIETPVLSPPGTHDPVAASLHGDSSVDEICTLLAALSKEMHELNLPMDVISTVTDGVEAARRRLDTDTPLLLETSAYLKQVIEDLRQAGYHGPQAVPLGTLLGKIILWCDGYLL